MLTQEQLEDEIRRAAGGLAQFGVRCGDRVGLLIPNAPEFLVALFATMRCGAVAVPVNVKLDAAALAWVLDDAGARLLIAHADLAPQVGQVRARLRREAGLRVVWVGGEHEPSGIHLHDLAAASPDFCSVEVDSHTVALQLYTSGSTGRAKGCLLSHGSLWWQARASAWRRASTEDDRALVPVPLYHANALNSAVLPLLYVGGSLVLLPGFDAAEVLRATQRYRPTYMSGVPATYAMLLTELKRYPDTDLASLQFVSCGSAPLPERVAKQVEERFGVPLLAAYGLTEAGTPIADVRYAVRRRGSCGVPVSGAEVRLVSTEDGSEVPPGGGPGELWVRSPANALGYAGDSGGGREVFTADRWVRTGDVAERDADGFVYILGRVDDRINCGGEHVYPREVETRLLAHPDVAEACVVAVPDEIKGQLPVAFVVSERRFGGRELEARLRQHCLEVGPAYAHPRRVWTLPALPLAGIGKPDRNRLRMEALALWDREGRTAL